MVHLLEMIPHDTIMKLFAPVGGPWCLVLWNIIHIINYFGIMFGKGGNVGLVMILSILWYIIFYNIFLIYVL